MQAFSNFSTLLNLITLSAVNQEFIQTLTDIVAASSRERHVDTILFTSSENISTLKSTKDWTVTSADILRALASRLPQPLLHFDYSAPVDRYNNKFNAELLTIVNLDQRSDTDAQLLTTLWQRLWRNTQSRLILLFTDSTRQTYIDKILRMCKKNQAMNVIALQPSMTVVERKCWTLRLFPTFKILKVTIPNNYKSIFCNHLENMFGHTLHIMGTPPLYPGVYNYTNTDGSATLSGYLGRSLAEYAHWLNATSEYSAPLDISSLADLYTELTSFIESNSLDIGPLVPIDVTQEHICFSGIFTYTNWCLMVPVEQPLLKSTFYYKIIHGPVVILFCISVVLISVIWSHTPHWKSRQQRKKYVFEYFANISVIQGLLGMQFLTVQNMSGIQKWVCMIVWFTGILFGTAYNAFLQSYSVGAPIDEPLNTIEDILNRGIEIAVSDVDVSFFEGIVDYRKYIQNLTVFENITEYQLLRDSFDTRYAFTVTDTWAIYDEQQKYFSRPLFRLLDNCFFKDYPMILSIRQNSLHRGRLSDFQARLQEAGLIDYWLRNSFVELLAADVIQIEDRNKQPGFKSLTLEDLHMVLIVTSAFFGLSIFCFMLEIIKQTF